MYAVTRISRPDVELCVHERTYDSCYGLIMLIASIDFMPEARCPYSGTAKFARAYPPDIGNQTRLGPWLNQQPGMSTEHDFTPL